MAAGSERATLPIHGSASLPSVEVDSYNLEIEDDEGFVGDQANRGAFWEALDEWRKTAKAAGSDPLGKCPTEDLSKKKLDALLTSGPVEAAGIVQSAIEDYAQRFVKVVRRFLKQKSWKDTQCIVVGSRCRRSTRADFSRSGRSRADRRRSFAAALDAHGP
jgi:hypothetical protein